MVFWCQGSNGVKSGASCIRSVKVLMGGMLGGILGDGAGIGCIPGDGILGDGAGRDRLHTWQKKRVPI